MNDCTDYSPLLEKHLADDLTQAELERLLAHAADCSRCGELLALHERLSSWETEAFDPSPADFFEARQNVLRAVGHRGSRAAWSWSLSPAMPRRLLALAASLALLATGFLAGRLWRDTPTSDVPSTASTEPLLAGIERAARDNRRLRDAEDAPYTISNVSLRDAGAGRVSLGFDLETRIDVTRPRTDPLVSEVLVQSLINPSPLGSRLKALDLAGELLDDKVRDAIVRTMLTDPDLAVRIEASERLSSHPAHPVLDDAFLTVLATEESVHMRLLALDYLTGQQVRPEALEEALRDAPPEPGSAVFAKANDYIQRF